MGADVLWSRGLLGQGQTVAILDEGFAGLDRSIALGELPPREALTIRSFDPLGGARRADRVRHPHPARRADGRARPRPRARGAAGAGRLPHPRPVRGGRRLDRRARASRSSATPTPSSPLRSTAPAGPPARSTRRRGRGRALGQLGRQLRPAPLARGRRRPRAPSSRSRRRRDAAAVQPLAGPRPPSRASVAVERLDPSGAWVEVQRSAPAGPDARRRRRPLTADAGSWRLVVRQEAGPPAELTLFSQTVGFGAARRGRREHPHARATPPGALTVGAVKWTGTALEPYSSQGPTDDGRAKPDLVGPTYVTSNPEWPGTAGTSAATAHVAGAAALLRQERLAAGRPGRPGRPARGAGRRRPRPRRAAGPTRSTARAWPASTPTAPRLRAARQPRRGARSCGCAPPDDGTIRLVRVTLNGRSLRAVRRPALGVRLPALRPGRNRLFVVGRGHGRQRGRAVRASCAGAR